MFTLDQARSFVAVAEELHFGRAAERLNMTQPPLSRQIQKLERSVGVELLDRDNRRVALTAAGHAFLIDAKRLVVAAERAPDNARRIAAGQLGEIRIGFTAASGFSLLGPLLAEISERMPKVHLDLSELVTQEQVNALLDGDLDMGLARPPFDEKLLNRLSYSLKASSLPCPVDTALRHYRVTSSSRIFVTRRSSCIRRLKPDTSMIWWSGESRWSTRTCVIRSARS
jgi:Transcriptional regulator